MRCLQLSELGLRVHLHCTMFVRAVKALARLFNALPCLNLTESSSSLYVRAVKVLARLFNALDCLNFIYVV